MKSCGVTFRVRYQNRRESGGNPGWSAEYSRGGSVIDHSETVGHRDMPLRSDARKKAERVARAHARGLCRKVHALRLR